MADLTGSNPFGSSSADNSTAPSANEQTSGDGISRRILLNGAVAAGGAVMVAAMLPGSVAQAQTSPALVSSRFVLAIDTTAVATFNDLVGIITETQPSGYFITDNGLTTISSPTNLPPKITLRRAASAGLELWQWYEVMRKGAPGFRRSCSLIMYDDTGKPVAKFWLQNAWPSKLEFVGDKGSGTSEVLMEEVTFTCEYIQRLAP